MWYTTGLLCGLLLAVLAGSPRADVTCDGVDDLLTQGLSLDTFINAGTFTLTVWMLSTGSGYTDDTCWANGPVVMDYNEGLAFGRGGASSAGSACVTLYDTGGQRLVIAPMSAGWHHLVARLSGGTLELFLDGVSAGTPAGSGTLSDVSSALQLCGGFDGHSQDRITEVVVYDTALSTGAIEGMARSRLRAGQRGSPTAYWPLDDCPDNTSGHNVSFKDRSGNSRPMTGNHGAGSGLTCQANGRLSRPWGVQ